MREILFRGKRKHNGEWVNSKSIIRFINPDNKVFIAGAGTIIQVTATIDGDILNLEDTIFYEVDPKTLGQYTGLTDKNGTKIFEGDIIQNTANGNFGIVRWYDEHAAFVIQGINDNKTYWLFDNDFSKVRIVGNIFDTPELLEVRNG